MGWPKGVPSRLNGENTRSHRSPDFCARGQRVGETLIKTNIVLDDETFNEIVARAVRRARSFCSEAREIIEVGLETLKAAGM